MLRASFFKFCFTAVFVNKNDEKKKRMKGLSEVKPINQSDIYETLPAQRMTGIHPVRFLLKETEWQLLPDTAVLTNKSILILNFLKNNL